MDLMEVISFLAGGLTQVAAMCAELKLYFIWGVAVSLVLHAVSVTGLILYFKRLVKKSSKCKVRGKKKGKK